MLRFFNSKEESPSYFAGSKRKRGEQEEEGDEQLGQTAPEAGSGEGSSAQVVGTIEDDTEGDEDGTNQKKRKVDDIEDGEDEDAIASDAGDGFTADGKINTALLDPITVAKYEKKKAKQKERQEKRKEKEILKQKGPEYNASFRHTLRPQEWSYIRVKLTLIPASISTPMPKVIDVLTIYTILSSALKRSLGNVGSSFQLDVLQASSVENIVIRVPSSNLEAARAALSAYNVDTNVPAALGGGAKAVDGCASLGVTVVGASSFLAGVVGPSRIWKPPS
ncbi:hypothetical protein BZA70DRAFT_126542 [Myxozyma melibiosi]|uniref:Ribonucleases P/MRP subunit Pop8-like domain-containing protein n=1 Tax=Myxozyma melibiosi TaxID=54550 RepID=A0ABR1F8N5_9ASCO